MRETIWFAEDKHNIAELGFACLTFLVAFYLFFLSYYSLLGVVAPAWPLMTLLYWRKKWPAFSNLMLFWWVGLLLDLMSSSILGGYALALLVVYCLVKQTSKAKRAQQSIYRESFWVFWMVLVFQGVYWIVQWSVGSLHFSALYLSQAVLSALLWPWFFIFLRFLHRFFKQGR